MYFPLLLLPHLTGAITKIPRQCSTVESKLLTMQLNNYVSKKSNNLKKHIERIHDHKQWYCDNCRFLTSCKQNLDRHIESIHIKKKFPCISCDFKAASKRLLLYHTQAKHTNIKFPCSTCPFIANSGAGLSHHNYSTHSNNSQFICRICGLERSSLSKLISHKRGCHGKSFDCKKCPYKTKLKTNLHTHCERNHEDGQIGYICKYCKIFTNNRGTLTQHISYTHSKVTETNPICK